MRANRDIEQDTDLWLEYRAKTSPVSDEYDDRSEENNNNTNNGEEKTSAMNEDDDEENEEDDEDDVGYDEMNNESLNLKYFKLFLAYKVI